MKAAGIVLAAIGALILAGGLVAIPLPGPGLLIAAVSVPWLAGAAVLVLADRAVTSRGETRDSTGAAPSAGDRRKQAAIALAVAGVAIIVIGYVASIVLDAPTLLIASFSIPCFALSAALVAVPRR